MGRPSPVRLVEAGPGDGTLMADALRAARLAPDFLAAAELWLVETSAPLRRRQGARLADGPLTPRWAAALAELPGGAPMILVANELLDCLPARQFVRTDRGWAERVVGLSEDGVLAFGLTATPAGGLFPQAPAGAVLEVSAAQAALGAELGRRIAADGGAALLIDYGRAEPGFGDTFQALRRHEKVDPLAAPGEADLTVHADFPAVLAAARAQGAAAGVLTQADLLLRLGILDRAEALARARPDRQDELERQLLRLVSSDQMGQLFKAACIHQPSITPPGFEADR
jgi:SAM-dependent MidA family methyltransferase